MEVSYQNLSAGSGGYVLDPETATVRPADDSLVEWGGYIGPRRFAYERPASPDAPGVRAEYEVRGSEFVCTSFAVTAAAGSGIRRCDLLPGYDADGVPGLLFMAEEAFVNLAWTNKAVDASAAVAIGWEVFDVDHRDVRRSLREPSRDELQVVAAAYLGNPRKPVQAVIDALEDWTKKPVQRSTANRRIKSAEKAGLLPPTTPGKKRRIE